MCILHLSSIKNASADKIGPHILYPIEMKDKHDIGRITFIDYGDKKCINIGNVLICAPSILTYQVISKLTTEPKQ